MARLELTTTLANFEKVVSRMRELGVASWTDSPVGAIILGPPPTVPFTAKEVTPKENRKKYYSEVLGYIPSDDLLKRLP